MHNPQSSLNRRSNTRYHEQSLDNFMKQIRKINLKSQRHLSPKPLLYMYSKNQQTNHTLERSRTLSNHKTNSRKSKKTIRKNVQKILQTKVDEQFGENPGDQIQKYCQKIKKVQKTLKKRNNSSLSLYLCKKFQEMLKNIVQNMLVQLNHKIQQLEKNIQFRLQAEINDKFHKKQSKLNSYVLKLQKITTQLLEKENNNNLLIYQIRKVSQGIPQLDIDNIYKKIHGYPNINTHGYRQQIDNDQEAQQPQLIKQSGSSSSSYERQDRVMQMPKESQKNENWRKKFQRNLQRQRQGNIIIQRQQRQRQSF